ncbi:thiosulfate oxidation carrier protein SoxY [Denitrobaculum tricleocarpae]|uniref:Thiosulfate oxidation carrier protein SoxY n=1 Tax=Denitrobaculum tricleocarpae TaxID=2591009 RepID=A0A545TN83_9PROT|nr:thiosulfate oxidation carrier protein SoxY [Denitrobaculum tricleocarpae]TQV78611.1 thiosulfate oxidation carrier protein SoxY [Denitrobaculum tricleocarpae]
MKNVTRRNALQITAGLLAIAAVPLPLSAADTAMEEIEQFTGGSEASESGKISLEMPEIAENGNTVPLTVSVDSPMSGDDYVKRVMVLADANPRPGVATFHFSPKSGVAEASTRMRLARTQNVIAVAEMSDGSFHMAKATVKVTIGGCGG